MKRFVLLLTLMCVAITLFAQVSLPDPQYAAGRWTRVGTRYIQNDITSGLAKANIRVPQSGPMMYEFNIRYENGLQDGHGGFGIHIFADSAYNGPSWGAGRSYLLWLNYDRSPVTRGFPSGLTAQLYRSRTNSIMDLVQSFDLNEFLPAVNAYINNAAKEPSVPVKIYVNGNTGEVRVYDPTDPYLDYYWFFFIQQDLPLRGDWVSIRTNGMSVSFELGLGSGM